MEGLIKRFRFNVGDVKTKGMARISAYEFKNKDNPLYNMRAIFDHGGINYMYEGKYMRLVVDQQLMMSDTNMEKQSNFEFVSKAKGTIFIAGLGLGLIVHNLKHKRKEIGKIVIAEKSQDVIDLVGPYFKDFDIDFICADVFDIDPKKLVEKYGKFDTIYFDIWPVISEDNLPEIAELHQKWKFSKAKGGWMGSWMQKYLRNERAKSQRSYGWW